MTDYKDQDGNTVSLLKLCSLEPEWARSRIETLCSEGAIKDRALVVARGVLEELCEFIWENFEDPVRKEHILRARDQVMNARLGTLSSDPFPVSTRQETMKVFSCTHEWEMRKNKVEKCIICGAVRA